MINMWTIHMEYTWATIQAGDVFDETYGRCLMEKFYHFDNIFRLFNGLVSDKIKVSFFEFFEDQR